MEGRVLIVEQNRPMRKALIHVFERRGYVVYGVESAAEASRLPHRFDCGIFADQLPDASAIALAGWFLAEQRVRCVVFFGHSTDVDVRLRASNLGSFVSRDEGVHRLERAVGEALSMRSRRVVGGSTIDVGPGNSPGDSHIRRRF